MPSPADTASGLLPATVVGGSSGWLLRVGRMDPSPDKIIAFFDSAGQNPDPRWLLDYPTFQARVRGSINGYPDTYDKAKQVKDVILGLTPQDIGTDRWASVIMLGDIGFMGYDDKERPEFSVNFRAIIHPAANALTQRDNIV
jgi:hypothetical protein